MCVVDVLVAAAFAGEDSQHLVSLKGMNVDLGDGVFVGQEITLPRGSSDHPVANCLPRAAKIIGLCVPPQQVRTTIGGTFRPSPVTPQFRAHYFVYRHVHASEDARLGWDCNQELQRVVLSCRLVRATALGFQYAARVEVQTNRVTVTPFPGPRAYVWAPRGLVHRSWLNEQEWSDVAKIRRAFRRNSHSLAPRLVAALHTFERMARCYYYENKVELLVRTIETLFGESKNKTDRGKRVRDALVAMRSDRDPAPSADVPNVYKDAERLWTCRSRITHGGKLQPPIDSDSAGRASDAENEVIEAAARCEDLLRTCLRRIVLEPEYAKNFQDDQSVKAWLERT